MKHTLLVMTAFLALAGPAAAAEGELPGQWCADFDAPTHSCSALMRLDPTTTGANVTIWYLEPRGTYTLKARMTAAVRMYGDKLCLKPLDLFDSLALSYTGNATPSVAWDQAVEPALLSSYQTPHKRRRLSEEFPGEVCGVPQFAAKAKHVPDGTPISLRLKGSTEP